MKLRPLATLLRQREFERCCALLCIHCHNGLTLEYREHEANLPWRGWVHPDAPNDLGRACRAAPLRTGYVSWTDRVHPSSADERRWCGEAVPYPSDVILGRLLQVREEFVHRHGDGRVVCDWCDEEGDGIEVHAGDCPFFGLAKLEVAG